MPEFSLQSLRVPIVQAPLAGGPSTPRLAAAVAAAGGLGFLAAGYLTVERLGAALAELRALTGSPFGVNLFSPPAPEYDAGGLAAYAMRLAPVAVRHGVRLGEPRHDDDAYAAKLDLLIEAGVAIVSFTFGCPEPQVVARLRRAGIAVWVTVTSAAEAQVAAAAGADALVVQGIEAGGHRGGFRDGPAAADGCGLLALLRLVAAVTDLPMVAAGGIADGPAMAAALAAGAVAVQLGTALLLADEAGTSEVHRLALRSGRPTVLTRAFSGRLARGIINDFHRAHGVAAPIAYPDVHHLTVPLRAAARAAGDLEAVNLWAGQAYMLAVEAPAAQIVEGIASRSEWRPPG